MVMHENCTHTLSQQLFPTNNGSVQKLEFNYKKKITHRVFTRMVSDNPWCSLWVPSYQSWTSKITIIFSCLHIDERTSLTKPDFQKKKLKFNKSATTDQSATSLLGLCEHFEQFTRFEGEGHKCSLVDAEKYKLFFVFQDNSIPEV